MNSDNDDESVRVVLRVHHVINDPTQECLGAVGSARSLGYWEPSNAAIADYIGFSTWQIPVWLPKFRTTHWKWVVLKRHDKSVSYSESISSRELELTSKSLMVTMNWDGSETITVIDPSVMENQRKLANSALESYIENEDKKKKNKGRTNMSLLKDDHVDTNGNSVADIYLVVEPKSDFFYEILQT